jgi:hypothetical protein
MRFLVKPKIYCSRCSFVGRFTRAACVLQIWGLVIGMLLFTAIVSWAIDRIAVYGWFRTGDHDDYEHKDNQSFGNSIFYGLLTFLGKDTPKQPRSWSGVSSLHLLRAVTFPGTASIGVSEALYILFPPLSVLCSGRAAFTGMMFFFLFIWSAYDANLNAISVSSALNQGVQVSA